MVVEPSLAAESPASGRGSVPGSGHQHYAFYRHTQTADQPKLESLLIAIAAAVDAATLMKPGKSNYMN